MALIKSISGIRGTVGGRPGDNLTPPDIVRFTAAYARYIRSGLEGRPVIVVGRDARLSGEMVAGLVKGTLLGCGADVIDVGLCTTPGVELAVIRNGADGGIIVTASHNPRQWNALKLLDGNGEFLDAEAGRRVLELSDTESEYPQIDEIGRVVRSGSFDEEHIELVLSLPQVDVPAVREHKFRAVVDAVNSVGGTVVPRLLERMGVEVIPLNCEPTGQFAHNPEPIPENLTEICEADRRQTAHLGIVVDPDVDRLALVCENGEMFGEEYTLVAVADYILSLRKGPAVSNLSSSRALRDVAGAKGCGYSAAAVGEVNVVAEMKRTGAVIGGEGNGGIIFPALHYGRDALAGIALFLTHLARTGRTMSDLRSSYPRYHISKNRVELAPGMDVDRVLEEIAGLYGDNEVILTDGVKVDFPDRWVHLRRSNTEPIIRIYSEAPDRAAAEALAAEVKGHIERITGM